VCVILYLSLRIVNCKGCLCTNHEASLNYTAAWDGITQPDVHQVPYDTHMRTHTLSCWDWFFTVMKRNSPPLNIRPWNFQFLCKGPP